MRSHFKLSKQERSGIFFLLVIIFLLQGSYFYLKYYPFNTDTSIIFSEPDWQKKMDSLEHVKRSQDTIRLFPFNPNFITDYKGYVLGINAEELERLNTYRASGKYVNTALEFQEVTGISDSVLIKSTPYFKFPEWTQRSKKVHSKDQSTSRDLMQFVEKKDLNTATTEELTKIYGVGDKLGSRIVRFRKSLGGFLSEDQLKDVYGLDGVVVDRILERFRIIKRPSIQKININTASATELSQLVYINFKLADEIVGYRDAKRGFDSIAELKNIPGFPAEKIDRIALYLFKK